MSRVFFITWLVQTHQQSICFIKAAQQRSPRIHEIHVHVNDNGLRIPKFCVSLNAYNLCIISITQSSFEATRKLSAFNFQKQLFPQLISHLRLKIIYVWFSCRKTNSSSIEILNYYRDYVSCNLQIYRLILLHSEIYWFWFTKLTNSIVFFVFFHIPRAIQLNCENERRMFPP